MSIVDRRDLAIAVWRTWGARGIARRATYEVERRAGLPRRAESSALRSAVPPQALGRAGIVAPRTIVDPGAPAWGPDAEIVLYGGLALPTGIPPRWHRQALGGHEHPMVHWSELSDSSAAHGDIKDVWELSRLGWVHPHLRHAVAASDDDAADQIWQVVEDWYQRNPTYVGPNWMCAQETSLRTISVMFLADALERSAATTPARRVLVGTMVQDAIGRVLPTLRYALSQRNNHASSEAGFLWSASVLAPWLPGADRIRHRAARALTEVVGDQFLPDGSYAQHSPTYQRVALHVLLWCMAVSRATGEALPDGVAEAVARSVPHLTDLVAPGSEGQVPNLGGNDGALVFDLASTGRTDFRPLLVHAAAASGQTTDVEPGPWDEEAAWFGLVAQRRDVDVRGEAAGPVTSVAPRRPEGAAPSAPGRAVHALTRGTTHAVFRAGPLRHRPAHADQLHVDVWLAGRPVAVDPGSYRYTAPDPWGNGLAGEDVHDLPRRPSSPQAQRSGRFFWRQWATATVTGRVSDRVVAARSARLELPDGTELQRGLAVGCGVVLVVDRVVGGPAEVRWNLPLGVAVDALEGGSGAAMATWSARFSHPGQHRELVSTDADPASGWEAPTYGSRVPSAPVLVDLVPGRSTVSAFADRSCQGVLPGLVEAARRAATVEASALADLIREVVPAPAS